MFEEKAASFASALYSLTKDEGKAKDYQAALRTVERDLEGSNDLQSVLSSYALPRERVYALIDKLYGGSLKSLSPFLKVVAKNHAFPYFEEIERAFSSLVNEGLGVEEGIAYSAIPLSEAEITSLEKAIGKALGKEASLTNRVEPSLIGGVKVAVAGKVFDGSIERRIEELRKSLLAGGKDL